MSTFRKRMWKSQEESRSLAQNGITCEDLCMKSPCRNSTGNRGGKLSRHPAARAWKQAHLANTGGRSRACITSSGPRQPPWQNAQSRPEPEDQRVSLCLAPNTVGPAPLQCWLHWLAPKAPEQRRCEATWGSLPNHTVQEEEQDSARMDTFHRRELAAP